MEKIVKKCETSSKLNFVELKKIENKFKIILKKAI